VVMDGHVRVEPTDLDCMDRPQRRFAWLKKKFEEVDHRIRHCAGSRYRIRVGSAVTVVDTTAVTVEDRHPCCRSNRTCSPPVASDCAIPSFGVENHHSEHAICELVPSPLLHDKRQPPAPALTTHAPLSGVFAHSVSQFSGRHGMFVCGRPGMLMILNVEYCLKFCFFFHPVDCCSVV